MRLSLSVPDRAARLLKPMPGRTSGQIAGILGVPRPHVATALLAMVRRGQLTRKKDEEGEWIYFLTEGETR